MSARIAMCLFVLGIAACQREPAIVIKFEPADLAGRDLMKPRDLAAPLDGAAAKIEQPEQNESVGKTAKSTKTAVAKKSECAADADCVIVPDGCCDCANGGKEHAVAKRDEAKLRAAQRAACKDVMCTMMVSTDRTCGKRPACVDGACAMRDARPDEMKRRLPAPQ